LTGVVHFRRIFRLQVGRRPPPSIPESPHGNKRTVIFQVAQILALTQSRHTTHFLK
jgi:hypothetical protein